MARDEPQLKIRLASDLLGRIQADAALNRRSLSAEVAVRLSEAYGVAPRDTPASMEEQLRELTALLQYVLAELKTLNARTAQPG